WLIPSLPLGVLTQSQRADLSHEQQDQNCAADDEAVTDEHSGGMRPQEAKQKPNGKITDDAADDGTDREIYKASRRQFVNRLFQFQQTTGGNRGNGKQKRKARGRLSRLANQEPGHDGRSGAARAGNQSKALSEAHGQRIL